MSSDSTVKHPDDEWVEECRSAPIDRKTVKQAIEILTAKAEELDDAKVSLRYGGAVWVEGWRRLTDAERERAAKRRAAEETRLAKVKATQEARQAKDKAEREAYRARQKAAEEAYQARMKRERVAAEKRQQAAEQAAAKRQAQLIIAALREAGYRPTKPKKATP